MPIIIIIPWSSIRTSLNLPKPKFILTELPRLDPNDSTCTSRFLQELFDKYVAPAESKTLCRMEGCDKVILYPV